jgi:predicted HTH domain antitoxin
LNKKEIDELNNICHKERLDRSALIRKFLLIQISEYHLKDVGEKYRKGLISLAAAATLAHVTIYDMTDYIQREKIQSLPLSREEMENELKDAEKIF